MYTDYIIYIYIYIYIYMSEIKKPIPIARCLERCIEIFKSSLMMSIKMILNDPGRLHGAHPHPYVR
jgi:hypothetical protein